MISVDGEVLFYDKDGKLILAEDEGGRRFTPIEVEGKKAYTVQQFFKSVNDEEGIYGLGQHQADEFNYKGKNELEINRVLTLYERFATVGRYICAGQRTLLAVLVIQLEYSAELLVILRIAPATKRVAVPKNTVVRM